MEHSLKIKFIYATSHYDSVREQVIRNVLSIVASKVELPDSIEVEFRALPGAVYGETLLDHRFKHRIRLHDSLSPKESIIPLIHELLHLNQVYTGKLSGRRDGSFMWNKKVYHAPKTPSIEEWSKLPWEIDVAEREKQMLREVLSKA